MYVDVDSLDSLALFRWWRRLLLKGEVERCWVARTNMSLHLRYLFEAVVKILLIC